MDRDKQLFDADTTRELFVALTAELITWYEHADRNGKAELTQHLAGFLNILEEDFEPIDPAFDERKE
jgi:hypothetical protein